jgi:hypothetical protein
MDGMDWVDGMDGAKSETFRWHGPVPPLSLL